MGFMNLQYSPPPKVWYWVMRYKSHTAGGDTTEGFMWWGKTEWEKKGLREEIGGEGGGLGTKTTTEIRKGITVTI